MNLLLNCRWVDGRRLDVRFVCQQLWFELYKPGLSRDYALFQGPVHTNNQVELQGNSHATGKFAVVTALLASFALVTLTLRKLCSPLLYSMLTPALHFVLTPALLSADPCSTQC